MGRVNAEEGNGDHIVIVCDSTLCWHLTNTVEYLSEQTHGYRHKIYDLLEKYKTEYHGLSTVLNICAFYLLH
jgi:hypothetical protein